MCSVFVRIEIFDNIKKRNADHSFLKSDVCFLISVNEILKKRKRKRKIDKENKIKK